MAIKYLKKSPKTSSTDDSKTTGIVQDLLKDICQNFIQVYLKKKLKIIIDQKKV